MNDFLQNPLMQILIALVMISFVAMEARGWVRAFRRAREKRLAGKALPQLPLARPFSFLFNCAGYADASLVTLIAMDMLAGTTFADNTILLALPLTVSYLAYLISGPLRMAVLKRLNLRAGLLLGAGGTLACLVFVALSALSGNFWAYVATIFVKCCFFYLLVSCVRLMPTIAQTEHERIEINTETDNADVSASALIGLVAGFAAQYLGNVYVYLIAMVPCVVLIGMVLRLIPCDLGGFGGVEGQAKVNWKSVRSFLMQPSLVALLVFALITLGFSGCYRSYLFPIFASDGGLNKAAISTITVFCSAFVFYAAPPLTRLAHRVGPRTLLTGALVMCACAYLGFLLTSSIAWAVLALFLVLLIKKVGEPCARTLWPRVADEVRLARTEGQAVYEVVDGIVCIAKMPVTGALLAFGQIVVCVIFGAYGVISAAGFWLLTRKGPFAD